MAEKERKIGVGFGVMILRRGKVLLGKRNQDAEKASSALHGEGTWTMPGGKLHFGESFEDGAIREALEETGIKLKRESLKLISITNDFAEDAHFITAGLLCTEFEGEPKIMEPEEITEWKWFSLEGLPAKIYSPSRKVFDNYFAGKFYQK